MRISFKYLDTKANDNHANNTTRLKNDQPQTKDPLDQADKPKDLPPLEKQMSDPSQNNLEGKVAEKQARKRKGIRRVLINPEEMNLIDEGAPFPEELTDHVKIATYQNCKMLSQQSFASLK